MRLIRCIAPAVKISISHRGFKLRNGDTLEVTEHEWSGLSITGNFELVEKEKAAATEIPAEPKKIKRGGK